MGSDTKSHLLPQGVRRKLMAIAQSVKKKHREDKAATGGKAKVEALVAEGRDLLGQGSHPL